MVVVQESPPSSTKLNCWRCKKLLAEKVTPPFEITCPRCHASNAQPKVVKES